VKKTLEEVTTIKEEIVTSSRIRPSERLEQSRPEVSRSAEPQKKDSELIEQLTTSEKESQEMKRQMKDLNLENDRLKKEIDEIQLNIPVWNKESEDDQFTKYNQEWEEKINEI
jgi:seryl-tRNA synthetase